MAATVRMNISVPEKLKNEMDAIPSEVNWSAVATEAFRYRVAELTYFKSDKYDEDKKAVERLKHFGKLEREKTRGMGEEAGKRWVRQMAYPSQLNLLEAFCSNCGPGLWQEELVILRNSKSGVLRLWFHCLVNPRLAGDANAADDFWKPVIEPASPTLADNEHFLTAFITASLEVWRVLKSRVQGGV
jgi:hypothetical protein